MEASSSKANDLVLEGLELEDLLSELHALKKLYGLLQKRDVTIPNGDSSHEFLDEKSKHVLKKLLDSAIHQALQSQAKIVCYTPEPPQPLPKAENFELKTSCSIEREEDNQDAMQQSKAESMVQYSSSPPPVKAKPGQSQPKHEPDSELKLVRKCDLVPTESAKTESARSSSHHVPKLKLVEQKLGHTPCPSISKGNLTRQNSRRSAAMSEKRSAQHHPHHHYPRSSKPRTRNDTNYKQNESQNHQKLDGHEQVKPSRSNGDLLANVPAVKRARGGPIVILPGQSSRNQTCVASRIDRELMHSKRGDTKETMRLNDRDSKSVVLRDENPMIHSDIKERPRPQQTNRGGPRSKPTSRLGSLKERETKSITTLRDQYQSVDSRRGKPRRMKSIAYSSSSRTMQSDTSATSSSSPCRFKRRMAPARPPPPPRRMPSRGRNGGMQPKKIKEEGRLKRFMNKLTVIFHHHHHHHHLLHDGGAGDMEDAAAGRPLQRKHRSPWAYIKSVVHHSGGAGQGKGRELAAKGPARVPAQQRQRGYLYAMLEGLVRHLWRTRRRNAGARKMGRRVKGKKLRWWQRFRRRRRGFKIPNKQKMPRLRLAFNR